LKPARSSSGIVIVGKPLQVKKKEHKKLPPRVAPALGLALPRGVASVLDCRLAPVLASSLVRSLVPAPALEFVLELAQESTGELVPDPDRELVSGFDSELASELGRVVIWYLFTRALPLDDLSMNSDCVDKPQFLK
jgi:hypothetical protein